MPVLVDFESGRPGTPLSHGLRHGYPTWIDEIGTSDVLQSRQMGHEVPGMRGIYSHVTPGMLDGLRSALQALWPTSLHQRAAMSSRSTVRFLDAALAALRGGDAAPAMGTAPTFGHLTGRRLGRHSDRAF